MINLLKKIEREEIIEILKDPKNFNSMNVDYHPPIVERIWAPYKEGRIYFHFIYPCTTAEALYHPHPWASAIHILSGEYEMGLGFDNKSDTSANITEVSKLILAENSYYEMVNKEAWHYVRPFNRIAKTVMITDKPWESNENFVKTTKELQELSKEKAEEIRKWFLLYYYSHKI
jgi:hypothetical protein